MATVEMTMHQLLARIKLTKSRLDNRTGMASYTATREAGSDKISSGQTIEEAESIIRGNFDTVSALISNLAEFEKVRAITNATTKLKVGSVEMTIADAIKEKDSLEYKRSFLKELKNSLSTTQTAATRANRDLTMRLDKTHAIPEGTSSETVELITKLKDAEYAKHETVVLDPLKIADVIAKMENEIEEFASEVDAALSYINAVTVVTVNLKD